MKSKRVILTTAQGWFDAWSSHFASGSPCQDALIVDDSISEPHKWRFENGVKCLRCGMSWGIPVRQLKHSWHKMAPYGSIRVTDEKEAVNE